MADNVKVRTWLSKSRVDARSERRDAAIDHIKRNIAAAGGTISDDEAAAALQAVDAERAVPPPDGGNGFLTASSLTSLALMVPTVTVATILGEQMFGEGFSSQTRAIVAFSISLVAATMLGIQSWPTTMDSRSNAARSVVFVGLILLNAAILAASAIGIREVSGQEDAGGGGQPVVETVVASPEAGDASD